jgi:carbonic anhydrase
MKRAIADVRVSRKNIEAARKLVATAKRYKEGYAQLGKERIRELSRGQKPTRMAIMPALALREFGIDPTRDNKPGEVFTVTCGENMSFNGDKIALGSVFYALEHLKIRYVTIYGRGKDIPEPGADPLEHNMLYDGRIKFPISQEICAIAKKCGIATHPKEESALIVHTRWAYYDSIGKSAGARADEIFSAEGRRYDDGGTKWTNWGLSSTATERGKTEALVVDCADSRVMGRQVFEGHNVALVSNAGNVLSATALDAIEQAVNEGVPAIVLMGHSNCGAVGAAIAKNSEAPLAEIMLAVQKNTAGWETSGQTLVELRNVFSSVEMLQGLRRPEVYPGRVEEVAKLISRRGTAVVPLYLDLPSGEIGGGI